MFMEEYTFIHYAVNAIGVIVALIAISFYDKKKGVE
jgi:hypothetical protein